jgi:NADPH:quinone reductase-like Zn-dependent oxidoreductase
MKAIIFSEYGPPEVLRLAEVPKPVPKANEVLIRVRAAEATKSDCEMRRSKFAVKWFWLPMRIAMGVTRPRRTVLGGYFSGEVESIGKNVTKFRKGDPVFGSAGLNLGAYGEYLCLPDSCTIVTKPANMSFEEAAAVPMGGLNALHFLRRANIHDGEKVLINGAGGSIGTWGVQIAKAMGAEVTAVDCATKEAMLRRIGADHFVDYTKEDFAKSGRTYDVILSMVARTSFSGCLAALNPGGRYLMVNPRLSDMSRSVLPTGDTKAIFAFAQEKEEELLELKKMIEEGKIKAVIDRSYPMGQAAEAHRRVETEQRLGPVVISMED